jgi:hypothetical protein
MCWRVLVSAAVLVTGCNMVPSRPDAVFGVYRDRMKSERVDEARQLLSEESVSLAKSLESTYKLKQTPEDLALLNALDPVTAPVISESTDTLALLQVRTMKGGSRMVRVVRNDKKAQWRVDLVEELNSLRSFLEARQALEMIREQAGEYASTWKAFSDRVDKMPPPETPIAKPVHPPKPPKPTKEHKVQVKKQPKKSPDHKKRDQ